MRRPILTCSLAGYLVGFAFTAAQAQEPRYRPVNQINRPGPGSLEPIPLEETTYDGGEPRELAEPLQLVSEANLAEFSSFSLNACEQQQKRAAAVKGAYKGVFYDNRFDYLYNPCYGDLTWSEMLKRRSLGDWITYDIGGEYRVRWHNEHNLRTRPLSGNSDDFILQRLRVYSNIEFGRHLRVFAEAVDASSSQQNFTPRGIEVNRFDAINLFGDFRFWNSRCNEVGARVGRQELIYGAQRLISPLDWSNTRRTFDGGKLWWKGERWDVDSFWARPVPFGQHVPHDHNFDSPDNSQEFTGIYAAYKGAPGRHLDFYFLRLEEEDAVISGEGGGTAGFDANLFGTRLTGKNGCWEWEFEGGYQFGDWGGDDVSAGFYTLGLGRKFECAPWKPMLWAYYDWESGDDDPTDGNRNTFFQYYPLDHKYLGFMDLVGRQNISDANFLAITHPTEKIKFLTWWHVFNLQQPEDALYNVGGAAIYRDATGASGGWIGHELDLAVVYTPRPLVNLTVGYSHLWAGSFFDSPTIQAQGATGTDADFVYTQASMRF